MAVAVSAMFIPLRDPGAAAGFRRDAPGAGVTQGLRSGPRGQREGAASEIAAMAE